MQNRKNVINYWIILAVTALGLTGIFTILLIVGRTSDLLKGVLAEEFFPNSLAVHVNLGILVWTLSMAAAIFNDRKSKSYKLSFALAAFAALLITISPFIDKGIAYTNNYIPIFDSSMFKLGIGLFLAAITFESIVALFSDLDLRIKSVALLIIFAFWCFCVSYWQIDDRTSSHYLYEYTFWAGGHVLQFAYAQILVITWLKLSAQKDIKLPASKKTIDILIALPIAFAFLSTAYIYATTNVETSEHVSLFTKQMIFGNGLSVVPIGILLFIVIGRKFQFEAVYLSKFFSLLMFAAGGMLGGHAAGQLAKGDITTVIPAHYHFSTIAITIALMGYVYTKLPNLKPKLAAWQLTVYTLGQAIYFSGLAILGGHGAARKTPGMESIHMAEESKKMVEHIMRSGGSLSMIGGFLFVYIVIVGFGKKSD